MYVNGRMFACRPQEIISGMPGHSKVKANRHPWLKQVRPAEKEFPFNERDYVPEFPGRDAEFGNHMMDMEEFR